MAETLIPHIYQVVVKLCVAFQFTTVAPFQTHLFHRKTSRATHVAQNRPISFVRVISLADGFTDMFVVVVIFQSGMTQSGLSYWLITHGWFY